MTQSTEIQALYNAGRAEHRAGRLAAAEQQLLQVVEIDPRHADAWHLLGVVYYQSGRLPEAITRYRRALALTPRFAQGWFNLGLALKAHADPVGAAAAFAQALQARPQYFEAAFHLGLAQSATGDLANAESSWRQALAIQPANVQTLSQLGTLLRRLRRAGEAEALLARAFELEPGAAFAGNLALVQIDLGRLPAARAIAEDLTRRWPDSVHGWELMGGVARLQNDMDGALPALQRTVQMDANRGGAWFELALARKAVGSHEAALDAFAQARRLLGDLPRLRWANALAVPALPKDDAEIDAAMARFDSGLRELAATLEQLSPAAAMHELEAAATVVPFHLHYLPRDSTALQSRFGDLVSACVVKALPELAEPPSWRAGAHGDRLRVGFVSPHWHRHTVSRYFADLVTGLDPAHFERFVWHTGERRDESSEAISRGVEHYAQRLIPVDALAREIRAARLDVLVYPDVGMDSRQHVLAAMRLAPRQLALYGHPVTTGLSSIDGYVSAAAYEPPGAASHYRERLHCLPGLGAAPQRWDVPPERAWFRALKGDRPALLCTQYLSKITPAFDRTLVRVLAGSRARLFLFDRSSALTRNYLARLSACAQAMGHPLGDSVQVLGMRSYPEFLGAVAEADLILDTDWFSGGSTSLDAIAMGAPVLTWRAPMARGRQTAGMLDLLGVGGLVFGSDDAYVARALEVLSGPTERDVLGARLKGAAFKLFDGPAIHVAFATLLHELTGNAK